MMGVAITGVAVLRCPRRREDVVVSENRSVVVEASDDRAIRFRAASAEIWMRRPITVQALGHPPEDHGYDSIEHEEGGLRRPRPAATGRRHSSDADRHRPAARKAARGSLARCASTRPARPRALRVGLEVQTEVDDAVEDAWQYFIPGALYNRNDLDGDGREDYLGTYAQDVRDDKNGLLAVLARYPRTGATFTLSRVDRPTFDTAIDDEALTERYFVQETDIGSLGTAPVGNGQVALRASFPFSEETTFSLDTDGTRVGGVRAQSVAVLVLTMDYELRLSHTADLTDAIWALVDATVRPAGHAATPTRHLTRRGARAPPAADPALLPPLDQRREPEAACRLPRALLAAHRRDARLADRVRLLR